MTIRTNPPGAQVYVDNYEIGRTPVSTDFVYYGKRSIRLVKDGYETTTVPQWVLPPWYQLPGIDLFVETFTPWEIRDERQFNYEMQPLTVVPSEALLSRAQELRQTAPLPIAAPVLPPAAVVPASPYLAPGAVIETQPASSYVPPAGAVAEPSPEYGSRPVQMLP